MYVIIEQKKSRTEMLENNPIKMGNHILENSKSEKYLGDQIHEVGTATSIIVKLNNRIPLAKKKCYEILHYETQDTDTDEDVIFKKPKGRVQQKY